MNINYHSHWFGTLQKKLEVWSNISRMVSALGVAQRTPKECKDKWGNTKKESKKVYSLARKEQRQTGLCLYGLITLIGR
jgi:hypothetical protein